MLLHNDFSCALRPTRRQGRSGSSLGSIGHRRNLLCGPIGRFFWCHRSLVGLHVRIHVSDAKVKLLYFSYSDSIMTTRVIDVLILGRIAYAMAKDGLIFGFFAIF